MSDASATSSPITMTIASGITGADANGKVAKYDDIPETYRKNVDTTDAPFDRHPGDKPALNKQEIQDVMECAAVGRQPRAGLELACETMKIIYAGYRAAEEGRRVTL